jgi:phosphoserine phosphatase
MIISCGTLDLIERILEIAGIKSCFKHIEGNRFLSANDRIIGIQNRIIHPTDKLKPLKGQDLDADRVIAVGDGYTDLPLLDWAHFPVLMDRSQTKSRLPAERRYSKIASISDLVEWIENLSPESRSE